MSKDPKLPRPDLKRLRTLSPATERWPVARLLFRVFFASGPYSTAWNSFRHYGPVASARFDHHPEPKGQHREGVLYAAERVATCIAEVFQATRTLEPKRNTPRLAAFLPIRPLVLLDIRGTWITRAGASAAISTGDREVTREWSRCFYAAYPVIDGILYRSSMDPSAAAVALFERAYDALPSVAEVNLPLTHASLEQVLSSACDELGYEFSR